MSLFGQQGKFVEYYLANNFDAVAAAKAAGYKLRNMSQNAYKLLDNPKIIKAIHEEIRVRTRRFQIDKVFVIANLVKTVNICLATHVNKDGEESFKFPSLVDKGLKCIDKIGKYLGMFVVCDNDKLDMPEMNVADGIDTDEI